MKLFLDPGSHQQAQYNKIKTQCIKMKKKGVSGGPLEIKAITLKHSQPLYIFTQEHAELHGLEVPLKAYNDDNPRDSADKLHTVQRLLYTGNQHYNAIMPITLADRVDANQVKQHFDSHFEN